MKALPNQKVDLSIKLTAANRYKISHWLARLNRQIYYALQASRVLTRKSLHSEVLVRVKWLELGSSVIYYILFSLHRAFR